MPGKHKEVDEPLDEIRLNPQRGVDEFLVYRDEDPLSNIPSKNGTMDWIHSFGNPVGAPQAMDMGMARGMTQLPPETSTSFSNPFAGLGDAAGRGLDAITPSRDTLGRIFAGMEAGGAHMQGRTPMYIQAQEMELRKQAQIQDFELRRQAMANQLQQQKELKRNHDLGLLEKALSHPKGSALLEQLANDPSFSLAQQAGMLHKGFKESDYGSFAAYKEFIPEDVQHRFVSGQLPAHELNAWLDEARLEAKENAKSNAKQAVLTRAINKPPDQRTPREALLVEEHQASLEVEKLKPRKMQSEIDENEAQAAHHRRQAEEGPQDKLLGVDREAITQQLFGPGTRYNALDQSRMRQVNSELLKFQGLQQLGKSTAVQQAQLQVPDKLTPAEREKSAEAISGIGLIDRLGEKFSEDFVGPVRGRAGGLMETYGGLSDEEAEFRASIATLKNKVIKMVTGAQMSEPEANRIMKEIPDTLNPPEVFRARLKMTRKNLMNLEKARREVQESTGADSSSLPPIGKSKAKQPTSQPQTGQRTLDELLQKYGGH